MKGSRTSSGMPGSDVGICRPNLRGRENYWSDRSSRATSEASSRRVRLVLRFRQCAVVDEILQAESALSNRVVER